MPIVEYFYNHDPGNPSSLAGFKRILSSLTSRESPIDSTKIVEFEAIGNDQEKNVALRLSVQENEFYPESIFPTNGGAFSTNAAPDTISVVFNNKINPGSIKLGSVKYNQTDVAANLLTADEYILNIDISGISEHDTAGVKTLEIVSLSDRAGNALSDQGLGIRAISYTIGAASFHDRGEDHPPVVKRQGYLGVLEVSIPRYANVQERLTAYLNSVGVKQKDVIAQSLVNINQQSLTLYILYFERPVPALNNSFPQYAALVDSGALPTTVMLTFTHQVDLACMTRPGNILANGVDVTSGTTLSADGLSLFIDVSGHTVSPGPNSIVVKQVFDRFCNTIPTPQIFIGYVADTLGDGGAGGSASGITGISTDGGINVDGVTNQLISIAGGDTFISTTGAADGLTIHFEDPGFITAGDIPPAVTGVSADVGTDITADTTPLVAVSGGDNYITTSGDSAAGAIVITFDETQLPSDHVGSGVFNSEGIVVSDGAGSVTVTGTVNDYVSGIALTGVHIDGTVSVLPDGTGNLNITGFLTTHPVITPVAPDSDNAGNTFIQDISFDEFGHATGIASGTVDLGSISHASLLNLDGDDHGQYLTTGRGDVLYYRESDVDGFISGITDSLASGTGAGILYIASGDGVSKFDNDSGYINAHPSVLGAFSGVDNVGTTVIQSISGDTLGHMIGATSLEIIPSVIGALDTGDLSSLGAVISDGDGTITITGTLDGYVSDIAITGENISGVVSIAPGSTGYLKITGFSGGITEETDPIFTSSVAYDITVTNLVQWSAGYTHSTGTDVNPHGVSIGNISGGTFAELDTAITNADLVKSGDNVSYFANDAEYAATFIELNDTPISVASGQIFYASGTDLLALESGVAGYYLQQGADFPQWAEVADPPVISVNTEVGEVLLSGSHIEASHVPTNYTATDTTISGHFSGVDTAIGANAAGIATNTTDISIVSGIAVNKDNYHRWHASDGSTSGSIASEDVLTVTGTNDTVVSYSNIIDTFTINTPVRADTGLSYITASDETATLGSSVQLTAGTGLQHTNGTIDASGIELGGVSAALGVADPTPAFDLTDATNYPSSGLVGEAAASGAFLYSSGTAWVELAAAASGSFLKTQGDNDVPTWFDITPGSIGLTAGTGLNLIGGNTINASGITITPGSGIANGGDVNLGGSVTLDIDVGGVTNTMLESSNITVHAGTGVLVTDSPVYLGGSTTIHISGSTTSASGIVQLQDSATDGTTTRAITPNAVYDISGVLSNDIAQTGQTNADAIAALSFIDLDDTTPAIAAGDVFYVTGDKVTGLVTGAGASNTGKFLQQGPDGYIRWDTPEGSGGGTTTISGATDTLLTAPIDGSVLSYDLDSNKWIDSPSSSPDGYVWSLILSSGIASGSANIQLIDLETYTDAQEFQIRILNTEIETADTNFYLQVGDTGNTLIIGSNSYGYSNVTHGAHTYNTGDNKIPLINSTYRLDEPGSARTFIVLDWINPLETGSPALFYGRSFFQTNHPRMYNTIHAGTYHGNETLERIGMLQISADTGSSTSNPGSMTAGTVQLWAKVPLKSAVLDASPTQLNDLSDVIAINTESGSLIYNQGGSWLELDAGTSGNFLQTQGTAGAPTWTEVELEHPMTSVNGFSGVVLLSGEHIEASHSPTYYTATDTTVSGHFSGIDTKINEVSGIASNHYSYWTISGADGGVSSNIETTDTLNYSGAGDASITFASGSPNQLTVSGIVRAPTGASYITVSDEIATLGSSVQLAAGTGLQHTNGTIDASGYTVTAGTGLSGGGSANLGESITLNLTNTGVSYGGVEVFLGGSDPTPAFNLESGTGYPITELVGDASITVAEGTGLSIVGGNPVALGGTVTLNISGATTGAPGIVQLQDSATNGTTDKAITPNAVYDISGDLAGMQINYGGVPLSLGGTDFHPAFNLKDATGYPSSGLVTDSDLSSGDILANSGGSWVEIAAGTSGTYLKSNGNAGFPSYNEINLEGLDDVSVGEATRGTMFYKPNSTTWTGLAPPTLGDQVLFYDKIAAKPFWDAVSWDVLDRVGSSIGDIADVSLSATVKTGAILYWDGNDWVDIDPPASVDHLLISTGQAAPYWTGMVEKLTGSSGWLNSSQLSDMGDINYSALNAGHILYYGGVNWANASLTSLAASSISLNILNNVTENNTDTGSILINSGGEWIELDAANSGYVLETRGTAAMPAWVEAGGSSVTGIGELDDVTVDNTDTGSLLVNSGGTWIELDAANSGYVLETRGTAAMPAWVEASGSVTGLGDIGNVHGFANSPVLSDILIYAGSPNGWVPSTFPFTNINGVTLGTETDGQVLTYDASTDEWRNANPTRFDRFHDKHYYLTAADNKVGILFEGTDGTITYSNTSEQSIFTPILNPNTRYSIDAIELSYSEQGSFGGALVDIEYKIYPIEVTGGIHTTGTFISSGTMTSFTTVPKSMSSPIINPITGDNIYLQLVLEYATGSIPIANAGIEYLGFLRYEIETTYDGTANSPFGSATNMPASYQAGNLSDVYLDKTATGDQTISSSLTIPAGKTLTVTKAPGSTLDAANKTYVDTLGDTKAALVDFNAHTASGTVHFTEGSIDHTAITGIGTNTHAQIDTHLSSTANPHATDIGNLGAGTLAELNTAVTDATLDNSSASRPPSGSAGGDLGGTYPNPTVDDGADGTAIHDNVAAEISSLTEKTTPVSADLLIIEDSAALHAKKKVQIGNLPGGGGSSDLTPAEAFAWFIG